MGAKLIMPTWHRAKEDGIHFYAPCGDEVEMRHRPVMKENGERVLIRDKEYRIKDLIQSHKEECEIDNIIKRAVEGDYNALNQMAGSYTDITGAPKSLAEAQQMVIDIKYRFDELPADIKAKFDYNAEKYVAEFGTDEWAEKTGYKAALEAENEKIAAQAKVSEDMAKAFSNLAEGVKITQKEGMEDE